MNSEQVYANRARVIEPISVVERERLERNSRHYHAYRHAVQAVLDAVPSDYPVPVGLGYALGVLREVHEEAEGEA